MERLAIIQPWSGWRCHSNGAAGDVTAMVLLAMLQQCDNWSTAKGRLAMAMGQPMGQLLVMSWQWGGSRCYGNGAAGDVTAIGRLAM